MLSATPQRERAAGDLRFGRAVASPVRKVESPVRLPTAAECVRFERESFGALHQMMVGMTDAERAQTWEEIEQALARFESPGNGFVGPCEMLVGAGTR